LQGVWSLLYPGLEKASNICEVLELHGCGLSVQGGVM
jgi:hypothetical protein